MLEQDLRWSAKITRGIVVTQQPSPAKANTSREHLELGKRGEEIAAAYLQQAGCRLVVSNFTVPVGRSRRGITINGEIDLIVYDSGTLCFVEVKTRTSDRFATPEANVDLQKQRQIVRAARAYRRILGLTEVQYRYDVVSIVLPSAADVSAEDCSDVSVEDCSAAELSPRIELLRPRIEVLRNFWSEEKFRKRRWHERYWDS